MDAAGRTALVTGSSRGIGAAVARELTRRGATVIVHGRDVEALEALALELDARALAVDLTEPDGPGRLAEQAGAVDLLVHCAGSGWAGSLAEMSAADLDRLLRLDLVAPVTLTRALLPAMADRGAGHVAFVASLAGLLGVAGESVYSAAKAGLLEYAESLRVTAAPDGVGVSTICPAAVDTDFWLGRGAAYDRRVPRMMSADYVARLTVEDIETGHPRRIVPGWLAVAPALQRAAPSTYQALAARFA